MSATLALPLTTINGEAIRCADHQGVTAMSIQHNAPAPAPAQHAVMIEERRVVTVRWPMTLTAPDRATAERQARARADLVWQGVALQGVEVGPVLPAEGDAA